MADDWEATLARDCITRECKEIVCQKLCSDAGQGYELLASRLGYTSDQIDAFKLKNPQVPARAFLDTWMCGNQTTIRVLVRHLAAMNRQDIIQVLETHIKDPQCMVVVVIGIHDDRTHNWTRTPTVSVNKTVREIIRDLCTHDDEIPLDFDPENLEYGGDVPPEVENNDIWNATAGQIRRQEIKFLRKARLRANTTPSRSQRTVVHNPKSDNIAQRQREAFITRSRDYKTGMELLPSVRDSSQTNPRCSSELSDQQSRCRYNSNDANDYEKLNQCYDHTECMRSQISQDTLSFTRPLESDNLQSEPLENKLLAEPDNNVQSHPPVNNVQLQSQESSLQSEQFEFRKTQTKQNVDSEHSEPQPRSSDISSQDADTEFDLISTESIGQKTHAQACFAPEQLRYFCADANCDQNIAQYLALYLARNGYYIVRPSRQTVGETCISVVSNGEIISYKIHTKFKTCGAHILTEYYLFDDGPRFTDIRNLLKYYKDHPLEPPGSACAGGIRLHTPVSSGLSHRNQQTSGRSSKKPTHQNKM